MLMLSITEEMLLIESPILSAYRSALLYPRLFYRTIPTRGPQRKLGKIPLVSPDQYFPLSPSEKRLLGKNLMIVETVPPTEVNGTTIAAGL